MQRRKFLAATSVVLAGVAGCIHDDAPGEEVTPTAADEPTPTPDDEPTPNPTDEATPTPAAEGPTFDEILQSEDRYAVEGEIHDDESGMTITVTGRVFDGDAYHRVQADGDEVEFYQVDGQTYMVMEGQCFIGADEAAEEWETDPDAEQWEEAVDESDLRPVERTTLDGEEVYVYVIHDQEVNDTDTTVRVYVSVETGYLRRIEFDQGWIEYHSWGEVAAIEPPDMECVDMDEGPPDQ